MKVKLDNCECMLLLRSLTTHKNHGGMLLTKRELERINALSDKVWDILKNKKDVV